MTTESHTIMLAAMIEKSNLHVMEVCPQAIHEAV